MLLLHISNKIMFFLHTLKTCTYIFTLYTLHHDLTNYTYKTDAILKKKLISTWE
jgi:hypothetical protein